MGKIQRFRDKVVITMGVDEAMAERVAATKDIIVSLADFVRSLAQIKAAEKGVPLPAGSQSTTYDPHSHSFVITFAKDIENL